MNNEEWKDGLPGVDYDRLMETAKRWDTEDYGYIGIGISGNIWFTNNFDCDGSRYFNKRQFEKIFGPIKKREPKPGEVWLVEGVPCITCGISQPMRLDGSYFATNDIRKMEYAAPSVKAYYARELLDEGGLMSVFDHLNLLTKAARLDEE